MSDADQYFDNWTRTIIERDAWKKRALEAESSKGTIHVAPCSCELHVEIRRLGDWNANLSTRIRELEAEVKWDNFSLDAWTKKWRETMARAAVAEAAYDSMTRNAFEAVGRAEKAEARVAELEAEVAYLNGIVRSSNLRGHATRQYEPAPATVGDETPSQGVQEREAD